MLNKSYRHVFKLNKNVFSNYYNFQRYKFTTNINLDSIIQCKLNTDYGEKTIKIDKNKTLSDFETELKKEISVNNLEFRRWNHITIAKGNSIKDALTDMTFIQINKMEWQILDREKSKDDLNLEEYDILESVGKGFSQGISEEKHIIADNVLDIYKKLQLLDKTDDKTMRMELYDMAIQLYSIQTYFYNKVNHKLLKSNDPKGFQKLLDQYYELKKQYARLLYEEDKALKKCGYKSKFLIFLGGLLFVVQLFFIYYLTFVKYSWDITEPMTYLTGCTNLLLICILKFKFKQHTPFQYFQMRFFRKTRFYKEDHMKLQKFKEDIRRIENKLN